MPSARRRQGPPHRTPRKGLRDVKIRLVPQGHDYFSDFSELAANVEKAAGLLVLFLDDLPDGRARAREILEREHVGDKLVHDVIHRLNNSFLTPIDREDIYEFVTTMDDILDHIEAAADNVCLYRISEPTPQASKMASIVDQAARTLHTAVDNLEARDKVRELVIEINRLENDGDRIVRDAIASLFDGDMSCTDIIKWKDIYEQLESAVDECEHVANIIESIVLKNT
jgi:predicted phosphate transport protein (TIGR00153 family)